MLVSDLWGAKVQHLVEVVVSITSRLVSAAVLDRLNTKISNKNVHSLASKATRFTDSESGTISITTNTVATTNIKSGSVTHPSQRS